MVLKTYFETISVNLNTSEEGKILTDPFFQQFFYFKAESRQEKRSFIHQSNKTKQDNRKH